MTETTAIQNGAGETIATHGPVTIQQALNDVMIDVGAVRKGEKNQHAGYNFRGIDAVVNAASPAFRKHGIVVMPNVIDVKYGEVKTTGGKLQNACRVIVQYVFTGPAGDQLIATVAGEAWDGGDKATPQAMSVAFRIALLQALCLPTDDIEVDSRPPYQVEPPTPATKDQFEEIKAGFAAIAVDDDEKARIVQQSTGRETNGHDMTTEEAAALLAVLADRYRMAQAEKNLTESLGAKPIEEPVVQDPPEEVPPA